jgi:hypothetical protein
MEDRVGATSVSRHDSEGHHHPIRPMMMEREWSAVPQKLDLGVRSFDR